MLSARWPSRQLPLRRPRSGFPYTTRAQLSRRRKVPKDRLTRVLPLAKTHDKWVSFSETLNPRISREGDRLQVPLVPFRQ